MLCWSQRSEPCDAALEREVASELEREGVPDLDSVMECGTNRAMSDGLMFSLGARGEAVSIYGSCRDRDAALWPTVATKLLEAAGFAGLALAVEV